MSHIFASDGKPVRVTRDLREWIRYAGIRHVTAMHVYRFRDNSCVVNTKFSDGVIFTDRWADYNVFTDYIENRSRNFRGVTYTTHEVKK